MDLMKTVAEKAQDTLSPTEQLHAVNEKKKQDLENGLLKEALALSSERCERSLAESNRLLQESEKNRQQDYQTLEQKITQIQGEVQSIQTANEVLKSGVENTVKNLCCDLRNDIVDAVRDDLEKQLEAYDQQIERLTRHAKQAVEDLGTAARKVKAAQDQLFRMDGCRKVLFWMGQVLNILTFAVLMYLLFNLK